MTDAVVAKVREVCQAYLNPDELLPVAQEAMENAGKRSSLESELQALQSKIDSLTANLDRIYTDRLSGLLPEADFQRIFGRIKLEREQLEGKRQELESQKKKPRPQRGQGQGAGPAVHRNRWGEPGTAGEPHRAGGADREQRNHHQIPLCPAGRDSGKADTARDHAV